MVPSLALVLAVVLVFDPILQVSMIFGRQNSLYQLIGFSLFLAIPTIIIGFTLTALNTHILKLYSGSLVFDRFPFIYNAMRNAQINKAKKLIIKRETLRKRIEKLEKQSSQATREETSLSELRQKYHSVSAEYDSSYPPSLDDILPTRFGNILKASEVYTGTHYGLDDVAFWPLLTAEIPAKYQEIIARARNELAFMVNMSLLAVVFYVYCNFAMFYTMLNPLSYLMQIGLSLRYAMAGLGALAIIMFFNNAAIYPVRSYGLAVRLWTQDKRSHAPGQAGKKHSRNTIHVHVGGDVNGNVVVGEENDVNKPPE